MAIRPYIVHIMPLASFLLLSLAKQRIRKSKEGGRVRILNIEFKVKDKLEIIIIVQ